MKEEIRKTYYENGNMESERTFVDGIEHGPAKGWFESGELEFEVFKENGVFHGLGTYYLKNGEIAYAVNYIDDELDPKDEKKKEEGMMKYILDSMKNKD